MVTYVMKKQRQLNQENPNINNNMMNNIQLSKSQEEEFKQYQKETISKL